MNNKPHHHITQDISSYDWQSLARKKQRPPAGNWNTWVVLAGRGFGKTRTGAETIRMWISQGKARRIALVGETEHETRQIMVEGPSGLLAVHPPEEKLLYEPSKRQITWPNGAIAFCYSGDRPNQLRGPQFDTAWVDELAKFQDPSRFWEQLMFTLRLGEHPQTIVTTTPRPLPLIKELIKHKDTVLTRGSTFENTNNLSQRFLHSIKDMYQNTQLGQQELMAEILDDDSRALWTPQLIASAKDSYNHTKLQSLVVAIDPAVTSHACSDETGIIVAGRTAHKQAVVLEDLSGRSPPSQWAGRAIDSYHRLKADRIVAEVNMGGDLVEQMLQSVDPHVRFKAVRATRNKAIRAQPVVSLYEQGKVSHARSFPELEQQMLTYVPETSRSSPDRMDALVWALTDLMIENIPLSSGGNIWSF